MHDVSVGVLSATSLEVRLARGVSLVIQTYFGSSPAPVRYFQNLMNDKKSREKNHLKSIPNFETPQAPIEKKVGTFCQCLVPSFSCFVCASMWGGGAGAQGLGWISHPAVCRAAARSPPRISPTALHLRCPREWRRRRVGEGVSCLRDVKTNCVAGVGPKKPLEPYRTLNP